MGLLTLHHRAARVVTWGNSAAGGDSCCVQEQLRDVEDFSGEGSFGIKL